MYSHSRLNTYFQCPLKYKFNYVDRIRTDVVGIEALVGSMAHNVLEKLYKDKLNGKENSLDDLLSFYKDEWKKNYNENVQIVRKEYGPEDYKRVGEKAIADYYEHYKPFEDSKTIGIEQRIIIDLNGDKRYKLQGYIDRLSLKNNSTYEIHDYKTSASMPTQKDFDEDKQLALYQIGVEAMWPDAKEIDLVWHYLRHDKEIRSRRKREDIKKLKKELAKQIDIVEKAVEEGEFEPVETALCNWCDFQELCPKKKHLFEVQGLEPNEYLKEDGVKLVNKYVKLKEEKKELTKEKDIEMVKIEEALVKLAKDEGYESVAGSEYQVNISFGPHRFYPRKTAEPEKRKELEDLVRKIGIWEDVSNLSISKLDSLVKQKKITKEQLKIIEELLVETDEPRLSVRKIKET